VCPHGNPIPGLDDLGLPFVASDDHDGLVTLTYAALHAPGQPVAVERISEQLQSDAALLHRLSDAGLRPGHRVSSTTAGSGVEVWADGDPERATERTALTRDVTDHVFVRVGAPV
jgi:DtxR family Mn-dependent transcriptional regulator